MNQCKNVLRRRRKWSFYPLEEDTATVALPIGKQPSIEYRQALYNKKSRRYALPDKGVVTFSLDAGDTLSQGDRGCLHSPLMTFITLSLDPNAESIAAYRAEHGEGVYGEDQTLLWAYGSIEVYDDWLASLELVDDTCSRMSPEHSYGCNGYSETWAEYTYPYMNLADLPGELWLAPMEGDTANMTTAVCVK